MSPLLEYFTKGGPINKDAFLATLQANPGAASDVDPKTGNTPLHFVCCNGAPRDLVEPLLQANPTAAATADLDGFLPLVGALSCGAAADVVDLLLAAHPAAASRCGHAGRGVALMPTYSLRRAPAVGALVR